MTHKQLADILTRHINDAFQFGVKCTEEFILDGKSLNEDQAATRVAEIIISAFDEIWSIDHIIKRQRAN